MAADWPYGKWNGRLLAVTADGSKHYQIVGASFGASQQGIFRGVSPSSIKEFQLQIRPQYWVGFKNIPLESGQKTKVQVVSPDTPLWGRPSDDKAETGEVAAPGGPQ